MGSMVSLIKANIYMEHLRKITLRIVENPPTLWKRFVDDTFVIQHTEHKENFLNQIKNME